MKHERAAQFDDVVARRQRPMLRAEWLAAALVAYLAGSQLLLWRFLDVMPAAAYVGGGLLTVLLSWGVASAIRRHPGAADPSWKTFAICLGVAFILFLLGGEGRLFYSNIDWQVRDAVLRDMAVHPWPFVYSARGFPDVLRAPLGIYFVPAIAYKTFGAAAADGAMLVQNSLLLATVMTLASTLFSTARQRAIALAAFVAFSGLDAVGELVTHRFLEHLDGWAGIQFSSTVTLAFWVPQHALAGWIAAASYLLWEKRDRPLSSFLTIVPLTALWSPLSLMGTMPFAAAAGLTALARRELRLSDVLLPLGAMLLCVPGLIYLSAADTAVGAGLLPVTSAEYMLFEALEALPYLVPLAIVAIRFREHRVTIAIAAASLLAAPLIRVGSSVDFTMRASIPALAIVAVLSAKLLVQPQERDLGFLKAWVVAMLCIGSATGASEIVRAVSHPPSPRGSCSFFKAWDQSFASYPKDSYLAPLAQMPRLVRPDAPTSVTAAEPERCWTGSWYKPGLL